MADETENILERYANHIAHLETQLHEHTKVCQPQKVEALSFWFKVSAWAFGAIWMIMTGAGMYLWNRVDDLTKIVAMRGERIVAIESDVRELRGDVRDVLQNQSSVIESLQKLREMLWEHRADEKNRWNR